MAHVSSSGPSAPIDPRTVLGKVRLILEALADDSQSTGPSELARRTSLPKASVHRICEDLTEWGVLERSGDGFRLGPRLFELGQRVPGRRSFRDTALPFLEDLFVATGETVHLAVLEGAEVAYVEKIVGRRSVPTPSSVARRMPAHCTATGKCLLAHAGDDAVALVVAAGLPPSTPLSITTAARLADELQLVRDRGYAVESEELRRGFASVACPVFGLGDIAVGAVAVTTGLDRFDVDVLAPLLLTTARGLSRQLGGGRLPSAIG